MLLDLPATARRNHNPCLVCSGALGYGKSYAAKRITRAEIQRGAQAFIVDPGTRMGKRPSADVDNKAVIDMAGNHFSCDPLRTFPADIAGGYWLDYMVPMMSLDPRSVAVSRLRTMLKPMPANGSASPAPPLSSPTSAGIQAPATAPTPGHPKSPSSPTTSPPSWPPCNRGPPTTSPKPSSTTPCPYPTSASLDVTIWLTGSLDLPTADEMNTPHLYERLSDRKRASVAIYGMLVRLARVTFFADTARFGLIVLEEAGALLNSRAGADDAHLISRRARKHYTGMLIITQNPIKDLALMGDEFITQQLIMPFENEDLARQVAAKVGIRLDDYPDIEEFFLAQPSPEEMRDPTAFDDLDTDHRRPHEASGKATDSSSTNSAANHPSGWPPNPTPRCTTPTTPPRADQHDHHAPTTFGQRAAEYLGYQLATRPRLRRLTIFWMITHTLARGRDRSPPRPRPPPPWRAR